MPSAWVLTSIAIIVISVLVGLVFFYVISPLTKTVKKQQLEEITSLLVNFVLFIWAGKILLNISIFIEDPLAILAYPSSSHAFYVAVFLLVVNIGYKSKKKSLEINTLLVAFVPVFLGASFVYEFIRIVWSENFISWGHLGLLMILIIIFMFLHDRITGVTLACGIFAGWGLGQLLLTFVLPFTTLFGYMMARWFLILIFIISFAVMIYYSRKRGL